jgi:alkyldihydroxyacetonephosphate synthase
LADRVRKFNGWGHEGEEPSAGEIEGLEKNWTGFFGVEAFDPVAPPSLDEIQLRAPRIQLPAGLAEFCSERAHDRALHSYGRSFADLARIYRRDFSDPPDAVAHPANEDQIAALFDWCAGARVALVPFGGGTGVVGGTGSPGADHAGWISVDMGGFDRIQEIDKTSRAARIQGGILGPDLEAGLKPHGLTLRHYPQSFQFSTLGGWIATRAGGHFATLYTHIDDLVESVRALSPAGPWESRRLPGSGAGPSPDRLLIGSEGILGIITEAWMRLQERPRFRRSAALSFADFEAGAEAVRALSQAALHPTNCRLIDAHEAAEAGAGSGADPVLLLGFEQAHHEVDAPMEEALACCADHGGRLVPDGDEAAVTWDKFAALHANVMEATKRAIREVTGRDGQLTCRFTHVYPDGPAPYFTFKALGRADELMDQYEAIKRAASAAVMQGGGTITHHHAVGRAHRPWYDRQRPAPFAAALTAAKRALDPQGLLNPGVLIDPA